MRDCFKPWQRKAGVALLLCDTALLTVWLMSSMYGFALGIPLSHPTEIVFEIQEGYFCFSYVDTSRSGPLESWTHEFWSHFLPINKFIMRLKERTGPPIVQLLNHPLIRFFKSDVTLLRGIVISIPLVVFPLLLVTLWLLIPLWTIWKRRSLVYN